MEEEWKIQIRISTKQENNCSHKLDNVSMYLDMEQEFQLTNKLVEQVSMEWIVFKDNRIFHIPNKELTCKKFRSHNYL